MSLPVGSGAEVSLDRLLALASLAQPAGSEALSAGRAGVRASRQRGVDGTDLHDLRAFAEGDDPRRIDAAATARSGRLQVRTVHEDAEQVTLLVADFRRSMLWGTRGRLRSVAAAEALALEGWRMVSEGGRVGLAVLGDGEGPMLPPRPREGAMLAAAGTLARCHEAALAGTEEAEPSPLGPLLERTARQVPRGASVIVATGLDDPGEDFDAIALALARRCRLLVLLVQDTVEAEPPTRALQVRTGRAVRLVRLGRSASPTRLQRLGIETRVVRADLPVGVEA